MKFFTRASPVVVACLVAARSSSASDPGRAEVLFREGLAALDRDDAVTACEKLEASQREEPSVGTLVKLGECEERMHHLLRARGRLAEAVALAFERNDARLDAVRVRLSRIDLLTPKIRIFVSGTATEVTIDEVTIDVRGTSTTPVPVDPGDHRVAARASGKLAWQMSLKAPSGGGTIDVMIPELNAPTLPSFVVPPIQTIPGTSTSEVGTSAPLSTTPQPGGGEGHAEMSRARIVSYAVWAVGIASVGVGTVLGFEAQSKWTDAQRQCVHGCTSSSPAAALHDDAQHLATWSTVSFVAGGAMLGTAAVLWLTSPTPRRVTFAPSVTRGWAGASIAGSFQ